MFGMCRNTWRNLRARRLASRAVRCIEAPQPAREQLHQTVRPTQTPMRQPPGTTLPCSFWPQPRHRAQLPFHSSIGDREAAVHDAVQAIDRRYAPYHVAFPAGTSGFRPSCRRCRARCARWYFARPASRARYDVPRVFRRPGPGRKRPGRAGWRDGCGGYSGAAGE